jgi:Protein of unknown function (DUF4019)
MRKQEARLFRRSLHLFALLFAAALLLCSCGSTMKNIALAKEAVSQFHSQLDAEQYEALYAASDEKLHTATTQADFTKLLEAVHRKLGTVGRSNLQNWNVGWYAGQGTTVTLVYNTSFSTGSGTERFVWHIISDNRATLYGYHINSNDLIAK